MSSSKLKATVVIASILIVLAVIVSIATGKTVKDKTDNTSDSSSQTQTDVSPEPETSDDIDDSDVSETSEPEQTTESTEKNEETQPVTSTAPASSRNVTGSGSITSNTGTNLNLLVKWNTVAVSDSEVSVVFDFYANCYTLNASAKYQSAKLVVDGKEYVSNTPAINSSSSTVQAVKLCSITVKLPLAEGESINVPISASWAFGGTYSNVDMDLIEASGTLSVQG